MKVLSPLLLLFFVALPARAETCKDMPGCVKLMFDLKGQRYLWTAKTEEIKFTASPDLEMTKDNAEVVFTGLLDQMGYARAPLGDGQTFRIVRAAERKEMEMPAIDASADSRPSFPNNTWDWMMMRYKTKTNEEPSFIESSYRLHLPREARMQADNTAGLVIVQGPIPLLRHMYEVIKAADLPISAATRKMHDEWKAQEMERIKAQGCKK